MDTKIKASFWTDPAIADLEIGGEVDHQAKLALLWLMTAQVNDAGWVEFSARMFRFQTGLDTEPLRRACQALPQGIVTHAKGFWLRHYIKHQIGSGPKLAANLMARPIVRSFATMPGEIVSAILSEYPELEVLTTAGKGLAKPLPSPCQGQEKEKEKEKEKEFFGKKVQEENLSLTGDDKPARPPGIHWSPTSGWQHIHTSDYQAWALAYPACNIERQLAQMADWLTSNPAKAHKSNWRRFVTNWLKAEQDRGGDLRGAPPSTGSPAGAAPGAPAQKKEAAARCPFPWRKLALDVLGWTPDPAVPWPKLPAPQRVELRAEWKKIAPATQQTLIALAQEGDYL